VASYFPIAAYTVRRDLERWLGIVFASGGIPLQRHTGNWNKSADESRSLSILLALGLTFILFLRLHR
jgi:hypothetical protein